MHELNVGVFGEELVEMLWCGMEGETVMPYQSFFFQSFHVIPDAILVIFVLVALIYAMKEIKVEITRSCAFEAHLYLVLRFLFALGREVRSIEFVGQIITITGITVAERGFGSSLRALIYICGVKILAASFDKGIHHPLSLIQVDILCAFNSRQTHHTEAQSHAVVNKFIFHILRLMFRQKD